MGAPGCRSREAAEKGREGAGAPGPGSGSSAANPGAGEPERADRPIRIAMAAALVSESGVGVYEEISDYLAARMDREIEFVTGLGYQTINDMLAAGAVDVGFVCGLPYVLLHDQEPPAVDLLVAPVMKSDRYNGEPQYYSDLIVGSDSEFRSLRDLAGGTYVFNEEISNAGYNMPRYRLWQLGLADDFFGKVLRSGSHEESIRMVAEGEADASFVDGLVLEYEQSIDSAMSRKVRVLESIGPAGIPPVVVSNAVPLRLREQLQRHLLAMHETAEGRAILERALVARFVSVDDSNYDGIREMHATVKDLGFLAGE